MSKYDEQIKAAQDAAQNTTPSAPAHPPALKAAPQTDPSSLSTEQKIERIQNKVMHDLGYYTFKSQDEGANNGRRMYTEKGTGNTHYMDQGLPPDAEKIVQQKMKEQHLADPATERLQNKVLHDLGYRVFKNEEDHGRRMWTDKTDGSTHFVDQGLPPDAEKEMQKRLHPAAAAPATPHQQSSKPNTAATKPATAEPATHGAFEQLNAGGPLTGQDMMKQYGDLLKQVANSPSVSALGLKVEDLANVMALVENVTHKPVAKSPHP